MFISFRYRKIRFHRCQYLSFCELSQTIDLYIELVTYINNRKTSTPRLFKIINQTNVIYQTIGQFFLCQKLKDRSVWWVSIHLIKPELFEMPRLNSYEFHRLTPPPPPLPHLLLSVHLCYARSFILWFYWIQIILLSTH